MAWPLVSFTLIHFGDGQFVKVPGESNESLAYGRWPGPAPDACREWAEGEASYELRRLATRRAKFFREARDELLRKASAERWPVLPGCPATSWTIRLLNASATADRNSEFGESDLAEVLYEILSAGEVIMLQSLSSRLALFGLLAHAGRRKRSLGTSVLSPVIWDTFTTLPHWSSLQRELWGAIRARRSLPLAASILGALDLQGPAGLQQSVLLLAAAQEIRLRSGDISSARVTWKEISLLVSRAAGVLQNWVMHVSTLEMVKGLRNWPLIQLLADLEVSDLASLQAMGRDVNGYQQVRFFPAPHLVPNLVLPYRDPLSDHDRDIGRFHCTTDFFTEVEYWIRTKSLPEDRMVALEVACWLPDCLLWAGHRLQGRISAACLEADDLATTAGRRSIKLNGFEGQIHMIQRRVTGSPSRVQWHCRDHEDMSYEDNIEENVHLSNDRRCKFQPSDTSDQLDHLATSIDDEVERLGFDHIDILKLSISSMDILKSASRSLRRTNRVLLATEPRQTMIQVQFLKDAGFDDVSVPVPEKSGGSTPYSFYVIARRSR
eukprot:Skav212231  [mRNA]  locus=scaffold4279:87092:88741:+ [translate_table: standard]